MQHFALHLTHYHHKCAISLGTGSSSSSSSRSRSSSVQYNATSGCVLYLNQKIEVQIWQQYTKRPIGCLLIAMVTRRVSGFEYNPWSGSNCCGFVLDIGTIRHKWCAMGRLGPSCCCAWSKTRRMSYVLLGRVRLLQCSDSSRVTREHPFQFFEGVHCPAYAVLYTWNNVLILRIILPKHSSQNHKQYFVRVCTTYAHFLSLRCHLNFSQTLFVFRGHSNHHKLSAKQVQ